MGFHTIEARYRLDYVQFQELKNDLTQKGKGRFYSTDICKNVIMHTSHALKENGILIHIIEVDQKVKKSKRHPIVMSNERIVHFILKYRINPRRVMDNNNYVGIFNSMEVDEMIKRVNELLISKSNNLPKLTYCTLARIDFCHNIHLKDRDEVGFFLEILKRCNVPQGFELMKYDDKKAKKKVLNFRDGITLVRKKLVEISFYNKQAQMEKEEIQPFDTNDANGVIRLEIRSMYRKTYHLRKKNDIKGLEPFLQKADEMCTEIFDQYMPLMFGRGDFYDLKKAQNIIEESSYSTKTKGSMLKLLKYTAKHSSLNTAIEKMEEDGHRKDEMRRLMDKFNKCNVSPITIPRRKKVDRISNPLKMMYDWQDYE